MTCNTLVQGFVYSFEGRQGIESTIENPIKTQCETPHPQPLSPKKGRGEQAQIGGQLHYLATKLIHQPDGLAGTVLFESHPLHAIICN